MARFRSHEDFCRQVAEELAAGQRDDRLWLESYVQEQGNEALARERYVRARADRLQWLAQGPGSETNEALPRMGLPARRPRTARVADAIPPAQESRPSAVAAGDVARAASGGGASGDTAKEETTAAKEDMAAVPRIWQRIPYLGRLGGATLLLLAVIAAAFLKPGQHIAPESVAVPPEQAAVPAAPLDAGLQASSAQQAALARRLLGKWECVLQQAPTQGEKFHYFYEYLPGQRLRFLGAESRWLVAANLHILEDASGPEASRADGMMEYRLDWQNDDRYVRTEVNFRSSAVCSRVKGG